MIDEWPGVGDAPLDPPDEQARCPECEGDAAIGRVHATFSSVLEDYGVPLVRIADVVSAREFESLLDIVHDDVRVATSHDGGKLCSKHRASDE